MTKFLIKIAYIFPIVNLPILFFLLILPDGYYLDGGDIILKYQMEKLNELNEIRLGFFGDSSCGHAIDIKVFGGNSANLSLVGDYNFSGTLEMIKRTKMNFNNLDTVIII